MPDQPVSPYETPSVEEIDSDGPVFSAPQLSQN